MHDLMIHVERIVRPVRARQSRKLKMRKELLAHLQAIFDEEREHNDDPTALDRAKTRLGTPADLTHQLQHTVPLFERLLLTKIPIPAKLENTETRLAKLWGGDRLSLTQNTITVGAGMLSAMTALGLCPWFIGRQVMRDFITTGPNHMTCNWLLLVGYMLLLYILAAVSTRFVVLARLRPRIIFKYAAIMISLQILWMFLLTATVLQRTPRVIELLEALLTILACFAALHIIARFARARPSPYKQWMSLDLAD